MKPPPFDPFKALEVDRNASPETIEAAYRSLMKRLHPDRLGGSPGHATRLNIARDCLLDPDCHELWRHRGEGPGSKAASTSERVAERRLRGLAASLLGAFLLLTSVALSVSNVALSAWGPLALVGLGIAIVGLRLIGPSWPKHPEKASRSANDPSRPEP